MVFKWLKRYQTAGQDWYKDRSKAPLTATEWNERRRKRAYCSTRKRLESQRYAQVGVSAIKWELTKLGADFPSDRTITRIIRQAGLVKKKLYMFPKGVEYPYFREALCCNNIHQMDFVGPRYIKGDGRFYSLNVIDLYSHRVYIESQRRKRIIRSLPVYWNAGRPWECLIFYSLIMSSAFAAVTAILDHWGLFKAVFTLRHTASVHSG